MKHIGASVLLVSLPVLGMVLFSLNCSPGVKVTEEELKLVHKTMLKFGCRGCESEEGEEEPGEGEGEPPEGEGGTPGGGR